MALRRRTENLILAICILAFVLSVGFLLDRMFEQQNHQSQMEVLKAFVYETDQDAQREDQKQNGNPFFEIRTLNPDFIGWIRIPDTQVDYPVMQSVQEPEYYIRRNFNKEKSAYGSIFADASCDLQTSKNVILYGHHMRDGSMFALLNQYDSESFYNSNKNIEFDTIFHSGVYEILGAFRISGNVIDDKFKNMLSCDTRENFTAFIQYIKSHGFYNTGITANYEDRLLTLATCEYVDKNGRFFLVAKKQN